MTSKSLRPMNVSDHGWMVWCILIFGTFRGKGREAEKKKGEV